MFCLSWIGMFYGCHLEISEHEQFTHRDVTLHFIGMFVIFMILFLSGTVFDYFRDGGKSFSDAGFFIALLATVTLFKRHKTAVLEYGETIHPVINDLPPLRNILPVVAFSFACGLLFVTDEITVFGRTVNGSMTFFLIHIAFGLGLGIILSMLTAGTGGKKSTIVAMVATVALAGGVSDAFLLSPLLVGTITGAFLINSTMKRLEIVDGLFIVQNTTEKIFMFILGYLVTIRAENVLHSIGYILAVALGIVIVRSAIMYGFAMLWVTRLRKYNKGIRHLWSAHTGQGIVAAALSVEFMLRAPHESSIFIVLALTVILSQILTVIFIRKVY